MKRGSVPSLNLRGEQTDQTASTRLTQTAQRASSQTAPATTSAATESQDNDVKAEENEGLRCLVMDEKQDFASDLAKVTGQLQLLVHENSLLKQKIFMFSNLGKEDVRNYSRIEKETFEIVMKMIERFQPLKYWSGKTVTVISISDELLISIMKLRLDFPYFHLARRYSVSRTSRISSLLICICSMKSFSRVAWILCHP